MERPMKKSEFNMAVGRLDGYLQAVRDMNDNQAATRYWFWADVIRLKGESAISEITTYINRFEMSDKYPTIREIGLKKELQIIESQILDNYLLGTSDSESRAQNYVKNLHGWRIQEYISIAAKYKHDKARWVATINNETEYLTSIFVQIKKRLIVMSFIKVIQGGEGGDDCSDGCGANRD